MKQAYLGLGVLGAILMAVAATLVGSAEGPGPFFLGMAGLALVVVGAASWRPLAGSAVAGAAGALVGAYLAFTHAAAVSSALCDVNATFSCDAVNSSAWSEVAGVPTGLWGAAFYAGVLAASLAGLREPSRAGPAGRTVLVAGLVGSAAAVFMAWQSHQLGAWCLFCMTLYLVGALTLGVGLLVGRGAAPGWPVEASTASALGAGVAALVLGTLVLPQREALPNLDEASGADLSAQLAQLYEAPGGAPRLRGDEPVWGRPEAPITVVKFADYECPHCALAAAELHALVGRHPDVRVVQKHYPLSPMCNPTVERSMHPQACGAAMAAICAQEQRRFWELNELLFKNQQYLSPDDVRFMAEQAGLDLTGFDACMADPATAARLAQDVEDGIGAQLYSTPTLVVQGVHPDGWIQITVAGVEGLEVLIRARQEGLTLPPIPPFSPP